MKSETLSTKKQQTTHTHTLTQTRESSNPVRYDQNMGWKMEMKEKLKKTRNRDQIAKTNLNLHIKPLFGCVTVSVCVYVCTLWWLTSKQNFGSSPSPPSQFILKWNKLSNSPAHRALNSPFLQFRDQQQIHTHITTTRHDTHWQGRQTCQSSVSVEGIDNGPATTTTTMSGF